jgi:FkbM family methyltransferase
MKKFGLRKRIEHTVRVWLGRAYRPAQITELGATMFGGDGYGGWPCLAERLSADSVVYSVGIGFDMQFDHALIDRFGLTIHGFDPTPRVVEWLRQNPPREAFKFQPLGLAWLDGELSFAAPTHENAVSGTVVSSAVVGQDTVAVPVARLETIMRDLGHERLDVLKMDIEGAEYAVLDDMLQSNILPDQLLVEFHHGKRRKGRLPVAGTHKRVNDLLARGYKIFWASESGRELAFARV